MARKRRPRKRGRKKGYKKPLGDISKLTDSIQPRVSPINGMFIRLHSIKADMSVSQMVDDMIGAARKQAQYYLPELED